MWAGSLTFAALTGRHGKAAMILAAFVGWTAYQRHDAASQCRDRHYLAQLQLRDAQLEQVREIAQQARDRADQAERELRELETIREEILAAASGTPTCAVTDDLRRRLLSIR
jgi:ribosomal 50S subunit-associated protein YjgA (DUF615 family)